MRYISKRYQYPCCILNEIRIIRILLIIEDHNEMKPIIHKESPVNLEKRIPMKNRLNTITVND
jgi:hypothetical protein